MSAAKPRVLLSSDPGPFAARCKAGHVLALGHLYGPCPICTPPKHVAAVKRKAAPAPVCRCDKCLARDGGAPIDGVEFIGLDLASGADLSIVKGKPVEVEPVVARKAPPKVPRGKKRCPDCAAVKNLDEFPRHAQSKDGHNTYCRKCWNARSLEYQRRAKARKEGRG